jgi:hypothetical protein
MIDPSAAGRTRVAETAPVTVTDLDDLSSRGRGLRLMASRSDSWGIDPTQRGSSGWFELLRPDAAPPGTGRPQPPARNTR